MSGFLLWFPMKRIKSFSDLNQIWIRSESHLREFTSILRQFYVNYTSIIRQFSYFKMNQNFTSIIRQFYVNYTSILRQFSDFKTHLNSDLIQIWIRSDFNLRNGIRTVAHGKSVGFLAFVTQTKHHWPQMNDTVLSVKH